MKQSGMSAGEPGTSLAKWSALGALLMGVAAVLAWGAGLVGLFMNMDTDENGLVATAALLVIVLLAGLFTIPLKTGGSVFALISAVIYAAIWAYLRFSFHRMMPDAILLVITGLFFIAPLITGITAIVVGSKGFSRSRQAVASAPAE